MDEVAVLNRPSADKKAYRKLSVVVPVYNEEKNIPSLCERLLAALDSIGSPFEIILVNDGSPDSSWDVIAAKAAEHPNVVALDLLRNYGQHYANTAGLRESTADAIEAIECPQLLHRRGLRCRAGECCSYSECHR